jgi:putative ABC transport system substrate-binding protein
VNFFITDLGAKRLGLLHELVPGAAIVAVLANPANPVTDLGLQDVQAAARAIGLKIRILNASNVGEIDAAFGTLARERPDAFMVINDPLFTSRRTQIVLLATRHAVPAIYSSRDYAEAGGLMSYSTNFSEVSTPAEFSRAPSLPTFQLRNLPNSSWSSICKLQGHSVSKFRRCCSRAPTR